MNDLLGLPDSDFSDSDFISVVARRLKITTFKITNKINWSTITKMSI